MEMVSCTLPSPPNVTNLIDKNGCCPEDWMLDFLKYSMHCSIPAYVVGPM
jgi:hypothetical protein